VSALHTLSYGDTGATPVTFLHGLFGQGRNWTSFARALAEDGYRVVLPDLPDHGRSPWTSHVDYLTMAKAVGETLAEADERPWRVVGHSMGGKVAMLLALEQPVRVDRLCVVDIGPSESAGVSGFDTYVAAMRSVPLDASTSRASADAQMAKTVPDDRVRAFLLQNLRREGDGWRWQANLDVLGTELPVLGGFPLAAAQSLLPYEGPVLWVAGARSGYVRRDDAETMRSLFPRTRLVTVADAGHWVHTDQPRVFTEILERFLAASTS